MARRHHYCIESSFGPADLFAFLRDACSTIEAKKAHAKFEFEWMKRRIDVIADSESVATEIADRVIGKTAAKVKEKVFLPRDPQQNEAGETVITMGVLLQTPDVYVDMIVRFLEESGLPASVSDEENCFWALENVAARALLYHEMVTNFPLPRYLSIKDLGLRDS